MSKLKGLAQLIQDAVDKSATAIEDVHLSVANEPLNILKKIKPLAPVVTGIQKTLNFGITSVYEIIRMVNRETGNLISGMLGKFVGNPSGTPGSGVLPEKKDKKMAVANTHKRQE